MDSARLWQDLIAKHDRVHVYTIHPGAHAIARELVPLLHSMGRLGAWYADGWSAAQLAGTRAAAELPDALLPGDSLVIGQSTDFTDTQAVLGRALTAGATTIFVFDHWKNYAAHFGKGPLPDVIVVPDVVAAGLIAELLGSGGKVAGSDFAASRHRGRGRSHPCKWCCRRARYNRSVTRSDGRGRRAWLHDWRTVLAAALGRKNSEPVRRILVKPHPRQSVGEVGRELGRLRPPGLETEIFGGDTERLIALASGVWGMTTVALNIALAAGKPIRSFQCGRNDVGVRASNPHIEPYLVK